MDPLEITQIRSQALALQSALFAKIAIAEHTQDRLARDIKQAEEAQASDYARAESLTQAVAVVNKIVEGTSSKNLVKVQDLVNTALKMIFYDKDIEFKIVTEVKRNQTVYRFAVMSGGVEGDDDSFGIGIYAVIAFVLKVIFNRFSKRYPFIVLDEQLKNVSEEYVQRTSEFMRHLAKDFSMPILLVTHDPKFAAAADHTFRIRPALKKTGPGATFHRHSPAAE